MGMRGSTFLDSFTDLTTHEINILEQKTEAKSIV